MQLPVYLGLQRHSESTLADSFRVLANAHGAEADIRDLGRRHADVCDDHVHRLTPLIDRYGEHSEYEPERMRDDGLGSARSGPIGLLRDLQDVYLLTVFADITWSMLRQAGLALRDTDMLATIDDCHVHTRAQSRWLRTRMNITAPQVLLAAE